MSYGIVSSQRRSEGGAEGLAVPGGTDQGRQTGVKTRANYRERLFMFVVNVCLFVCFCI